MNEEEPPNEYGLLELALVASIPIILCLVYSTPISTYDWKLPKRTYQSK